MRLFIAVPGSSEAAAAVSKLIEGLRPSCADVKWVDAAQVHLTLSFQGETAADRLPLLKESIAAAASSIGSFELELTGLGAFPSLKDPSVLWIGAGRGRPELEALASSLRGELERRNLLNPQEKERPFAAHLTIGRRRGLKDRHPLRKLLAEASFSQPFLVDRLVLYQSRFEAGKGHVHAELFSAALG
jgi:RNA 2',3'-cyclic 3'-phosphodiesterase